MGKRPEMKVIIHYPRTPEGQRDLAARVAQAHADLVARTVAHLDCPIEQKKQLLDAVIADSRAARRDSR